MISLEDGEEVVRGSETIVESDPGGFSEQPRRRNARRLVMASDGVIELSFSV